MQREIHALERNPFDVLVIGGGVYGAALAREAATRGLRTALIEQGDFCGATSANSLKIIHGGLRYLQQADVPRLRESVRERRAWMRIAGHLVHPLPCLMPTTRKPMKSRPALFAGLLLNDMLSCDRNRLSDPSKRIPRGRVISRAACAARIPGLDPARMTGGATWYDAAAYNTERLVLGMVRSAVHDGNATVANYCRAVGLTVHDDTVVGAEAVDCMTGRRFSVSAGLVINAAGPWINAVIDLTGRANLTRPVPALSLAINVVLGRQLIPEWAAGLASPREGDSPERLLFLMPWRGVTLAGTYYREHRGAPETIGVTPADLDAFLAALQRAYPAARVTRDDVALIHAGLLPMRPEVPAGGEPDLLRHYDIVDHAKTDGLPGLISVLGVKYTTARDVAERAVRLAGRVLKRRLLPSVSALRPLPGGDVGHWDLFLAELEARAPDGFTPSLTRRLALTYGTEALQLIESGKQDADLLKPVHPACGLLGVEVLHAVRREMAMHLGDVVFRRSELGSAGLPAREAVAGCARVMQSELGWDDERTQAEIERVLQARFPGQDCL